MNANQLDQIYWANCRDHNIGTKDGITDEVAEDLGFLPPSVFDNGRLGCSNDGEGVSGRIDEIRCTREQRRIGLAAINAIRRNNSLTDDNSTA